MPGESLGAKQARAYAARVELPGELADLLELRRRERAAVGLVLGQHLGRHFMQRQVNRLRFGDTEQRKVLNRMLEAGPGRFEGGLTPRKYQALTGSTKVTASRHIADLVAKGVIVRAEGAAGRSTYYNLAIPDWEWRPREVRRDR